MVTRVQHLGWILGPEDRRIAAHIPQSRGFALRHGVRGAQLMVAPADVREIAPEAIQLRSDASRSLVDPMLADRMGGPVLTDLESPPEAVLALNAAFQLVVDVPGADLQFGQTVQIVAPSSHDIVRALLAAYRHHSRRAFWRWRLIYPRHAARWDCSRPRGNPSR